MGSVQTVLIVAGGVVGLVVVFVLMGPSQRGAEGFHRRWRRYWVGVGVWAVLWAAAGGAWGLRVLLFSLVLYIGVIIAIRHTQYIPIPAFLKRAIAQSRFWPKRRIADIDEILARPRDRNSDQRHTAQED